MNIVKTRAVLSLVLLLLFIIVTITGIGLFLAPKHGAETWTFIGWKKDQIKQMHTVLGFIMSLLILIHLYINRHMLYTEVQTLINKRA